ncbi:hypothetical protein [Sporisorium scitamineum]|uniref:Uncharacterized protein n=1 Tax=Sporisorium scitamineum TaxID=49012 RepID=A0A0F7S7I5_9BASI|nr:hypothetical protein [Sporisorium scitamineum]
MTVIIRMVMREKWRALRRKQVDTGDDSALKLPLSSEQ